MPSFGIGGKSLRGARVRAAQGARAWDILEGLAIALANIDEIIAAIKASPSARRGQDCIDVADLGLRRGARHCCLRAGRHQPPGRKVKSAALGMWRAAIG